MLRGFWRVASLAIVLGLGLSLVAADRFGKLKAKRAFKDANVLYAQQEYKKAAALYEEAIAYDPELSVAYFFLANSYDNLYKPSRKGEPENDALPRRRPSSTTRRPRKRRQDPTLQEAGDASTSWPPTVPTR